MEQENSTDKVYDSTYDTIEHIQKVQHYLKIVSVNLDFRGNIHDASKLRNPEKAIFDRETPNLKNLTYGSDEYKEALVRLGDALEHHYAVNDHHPEFWTNGVNDMSLMSIIEMLCDWKAASERHNDGNFEKSLEINKDRFGISDQLYGIFKQTAKEMGWL